MLEKSSRLCRRRDKIERRRDYFAGDDAKAPKTAKFEPRMLPWVASFCLILFFCAARRHVTLVGVENFCRRRRAAENHFRFFCDGKRAGDEKRKRRRMAAVLHDRTRRIDQAPSLRTCACSREIFRDAEFL